MKKCEFEVEIGHFSDNVVILLCPTNDSYKK